MLIGCVIHSTERGSSISKAFIADVIKQSATLTGAGANRTATNLMAAIVKELKKAGKTVRFKASPTLKKAV